MKLNTVFDIGANVGKTIDFFLQYCDNIVAFEANPKLSELLNKKYFGKDNITIINKGISNHIGKQIFNISNANTISTFSNDFIENSRFTGKYNWNSQVEVDVITLDESIRIYGTPDFIKIDIEGFEYEVLTEFKTLLSDTVISFEWHEEQYDKIVSIIEHVSHIGYNNFFMTEKDSLILPEDITWGTKKSLSFYENSIPERKEYWGMIYFKK